MKKSLFLISRTDADYRAFPLGQSVEFAFIPANGIGFTNYLHAATGDATMTIGI